MTQFFLTGEKRKQIKKEERKATELSSLLSREEKKYNYQHSVCDG
jgi:hypothetical protein